MPSRRFTLEEIEAHQKRHGFAPSNSAEGAIVRATLPVTAFLPAKGHKTPEKGSKARHGALKEPNMTEWEYALILASKHPECQILYEKYTLTLSAGCRYTPDFAVVFPYGRVEFHEVKGAFIFSRALVKPKVAAAMFPQHQFTLAQKHKTGGWEINILSG